MIDSIDKLILKLKEIREKDKHDHSISVVLLLEKYIRRDKTNIIINTTFYEISMELYNILHSKFGYELFDCAKLIYYRRSRKLERI